MIVFLFQMAHECGMFIILSVSVAFRSASISARNASETRLALASMITGEFFAGAAATTGAVC